MGLFVFCALQTQDKHLDEVCTIFPLPVLLSPASTVQEVRGYMHITKITETTLYRDENVPFICS